MARAQAQDDYSLPALPPELVEHIANFLEIADVVCLSLCNKRLYRQYCTPRRLELVHRESRHQDQRTKLLTQIARDIPTLYCCHSCSNLHAVARVGPAIDSTCLDDNSWTNRSRCVEHHNLYHYPRDCCGNHKDNGAYRLKFQHVQLAMERYRRGEKYGIPLNFLAMKEVRCEDDAWTLCDVEPGIINGELLLRVQSWTVFNKPQKPGSWTGQPPICAHLDRNTSTVVQEMLEWQDQYAGQPQKGESAVFRRSCSSCGVLFELETMILPTGKRAFILTKWLDFGTGVSPAGPKWQRHLPQDINEVGWAFRPYAMKHAIPCAKVLFEE